MYIIVQAINFFITFNPQNNCSIMRKALQGIFLTGLMAFGFNTVISDKAQAQVIQDKYWGQWDIPYVEQRGWSLGWNIGLADMWGDVGTYKLMDKYTSKKYTGDILKNIRGMGGMYAKYTHIPGLGFRIGVNYGKVYATDEWNYDKAIVAKSITEDPYQRYIRNLDANTTIWEGSFLIELAPLRTFSNWEFGKMAKMRFQPYILLGATGFYFNPRGTFTDLVTNQEKWVDLRELRTEGQGFVVEGKEYPKPYSVFSYAVAGGIGFKWDIGTGLSLGVEYLMRYTFTDYLDDASGAYADVNHRDIAFMDRLNKQYMSQRMSDKSSELIPGYVNPAGKLRGNPDDNDMFSSISLNLTWKVKWREIGWWSNRR